MKSGKVVPLEECCIVEYGTRVVQKRDGGSGYPVYGGGGATFQMKTYNRQNRVVVARFGMSEECTRFVEGDFFLNDSGLTVSPKDDSLLQRFLDLQLISLNDCIWGLGKGAAQKNLDVPAFRQLPIFVPDSKSEQQRIVSILDEAFEGIATATANAERNLSNARELFESYLQNVSGIHDALGGYVNITTGKLDSNAAIEGGQYPFFTCSRQIFAIDKFAFDCEAILLAGNNASGDFNVKHYNGKFNAYQRTYVITVKDESRLLYRYLYFQMLSSLKSFKRQAVGANTKFLKLPMIKGLQIPLPPISEQHAIVAKLDGLTTELAALEAIYQQKLLALSELKKSILHQAFTGQLH